MVKVLVIISSNDEKALVSFMWATNAVKYKWAEDVEIILFGPIEEAVADEDERFLPGLKSLENSANHQSPAKG